MKYLQYLATSVLAITILLSFQACSSDDSPFLETEETTEIVTDTTVIENTFTYQSSSGIVDYSGVFFTCTEDGDRYVNALVFGQDFDVINGQATSSGDLFFQHWLSEGPLSPGIYLTEGEISSSEPITNPEPFFEITITEANEFIVRGSFKSVNLDPGPWFEDVSGDFVLQSYDCAVLELEPGDIEDWSEYAKGRATLFQAGAEEVVMAAAGTCEELILDQGQPIGIVFLGGLLEIFDGSVELGPGNITNVVLVQEGQYEAGQTYEGVYLAAPLDLNLDISEMSWDEVKLLGQAVTIKYDEIDIEFTSGQVFDENLRVIADFNASTFTECG